MTSLHWILIAVVIVVVGCVSLYLRRHGGNDPWQGMDDESADIEADEEHGVSLDGDSYTGEVRTLSRDEVRGGPAAGQGSQDPDAEWKRYKEEPADPEVAAAPNNPAPQPPPARPEQPTPKQPEPAPEPARPSASARVDNIRVVRPPAGEERIFQLHVAAPEGYAFDGPDVHAALDAEGLKFGLHDLYHRVTDANGEIQSVYCVANMLNPGVLDPVDQDHLRTPGLAMFLVLPGVIEGGRAMRDMMETANGIAQRLGGQVLDDKRSLLKAQTAQYMLDEIAEIDRQARLRSAN